MSKVSALDEKLAALTGWPRVDAGFVRGFVDAVAKAPDDELVRINARLFAQGHGLDERATLDVLLIGAKLGLFDFQFHLVCPGCGALETTTASWNGLHKESTWCAVCDADVPVILDDHVEITFSPAESVRALHVDPYRDQASYWGSFFSHAFERSPPLTAPSKSSSPPTRPPAPRSSSCRRGSRRAR
jgi:hypothetical protein